MTDHLDKETSVAVAVTESGVEAKAKSRTVAALDRLGGNLLEWPNVLLEEGTTRRRAKIDGEKKIIEAVAARAVQLIGTDDEFATRAIANHYGNIARKQLNKDGVAIAALDDLRTNPPTLTQQAEGPDEVSPEFLDRLDSYAEAASTDDLRERWGRVLASEIRAPGTFSSSVMRIVDEIDAEVAQAFEAVCKFRFRDALFRPTMGEIPFHRRNMLLEFGLIIDPGISGQVWLFEKAKMSDGRNIVFRNLGNVALGFDATKTVHSDENSALTIHENGIAIPIYMLTRAGYALSSILPDNTTTAVNDLVLKIKAFASDVVVFEPLSDGSGGWRIREGSFPDAAPPPDAATE